MRWCRMEPSSMGIAKTAKSCHWISVYSIACIIFLFGQSRCQLQIGQACGSYTAENPGPPRSLSTISAQQLASGALNGTFRASWDFEGQPNVLTALAGTIVSLSCLSAVNVTLSSPDVSTVFLQPTAINISAATGLAMDSVSFSTDCQTVWGYQTHLCKSYRAAGSLMLELGVVHFTHWRDNFTTLNNVTLTCPSPGEAPKPPCRLVAVQTVEQLREAFASYVTAVEANTTVVVAANITITRSAWPAVMPISNNVTLVGSSLLYRPVLDMSLMVGLWDLLPDAHVVLINVTMANLAPAYFPPSASHAIFAMLGERVWAFSRMYQQVHLDHCTLAISEQELAFTKYWITFLVSPVPEAQAKAAWLSVISIKIQEVNSTGVFYQSVRSFTTTYLNVHLTSSLGPGYPLLPQNTGLAQLQSEEVPLTAVRQVKSASDMLTALHVTTPDKHAERWQLLVANFTLADAEPLAASGTTGGGSAIVLPGSTVFVKVPRAWGLRLGLGSRVGSLSVPDHTTATMRELILGELAPQSLDYDPNQPLGVLLSPLWNIELVASFSKVLLQNCTVLVSGKELALLQHSLLTPEEARGLPAAGPLNSALVAAVQAFFYTTQMLHIASFSRSHILVDAGTTARYEMYGVMFRTPVTADGEAEAADFTSPPGGSGGSGGLEEWEVGVIVGCVVGGVLLLVLGLFVAVRRNRRRGQGQPGSDGGGQRAYEKYLPGSAKMGGPSGSTSDMVQASQELTNSSQMLRPSAPNISDNAAVVAGELKSGSATNSAALAFATASGGISIAGPSASGMGLASHGNSSGAVAAAAGSSAAAAGRGDGDSGSGSNLPPSKMRSALSLGTAGLSSQSHGQVTDSFDRAPSTSFLGQHGGGTGDRPPTVIGASSAATTGTSSARTTNQEVLASGGGAALQHMHQMIQVMGREFNDRQLELQHLLGKGAHGTVYRGRWRRLPVAVKSMIFSSENTARQQHRPLLEAAISSNLAHPNIVTTYSYELREVEHELASLSPELARTGGGWRLLIIQEYCDAGPLRRIIDCGFFLTPPKPSPLHGKRKLPSVGLLRKESYSAATGSEGSTGGAGRPEGAAAAVNYSRGSSGNCSAYGGHGYGSGGQGSPAGGGGNEPAGSWTAAGAQAYLEDVPPDVPPRPISGLQAATRYVEAALMIARGLQHIHDKNIVHGDLNPNNVLLMRAPDSPLGFCLKVADFGLSVRMAEGESHMSNLFQGSPYYCAPETVINGKVGKPADIYSLGIMLWELQNGTRPMWRRGLRLRFYPSLNTGELEFRPETPLRYARLTRDCFHGSKDARPSISSVVDDLVAIKAELDALQRP